MKVFAGNARRGFTLIELLVAIGVLALVSVGLAVIFGSIGETVNEGRRASTLNRAAERIEAQLRADIERLTRDGHMVIVNRYASEEASGATQDPIEDVRLSPRDAQGRHRRADEIMFFARGDFVTKRPALVGGVNATANEAAIYYGIGQKRVPDLETALNNPNNFFFNPFPTDSNLESTSRRPYAPLLGRQAPSGAPANPNRYAQDWSLLRQTTLITMPAARRVVPEEVYQWERDDVVFNAYTILDDSDRQIAFQPAARSIFHSLSWTDPAAYSGSRGSPRASGDGRSRWWIGDTAEFPSPLSSPALRSLPAWRSSGVVDIAQGSLVEIRRQMQALAALGRFPGFYLSPDAVRPFNPRPARPNQSFDAFYFDWTDSNPTVPTDLGPDKYAALDIFDNALQRDALRAWALDSMPSLWNTSVVPPVYLAGVRYEDNPTRLVFEEELFDDTDAGRLGRAIAEANQEMLASQVFVPRVTEFIVEWSYGTVDVNLTPGDPGFRQMQWFGLPRATRDDNNDGVIDMDDHEDAPDVLRYSRTNLQTYGIDVSANQSPGKDPIRLLSNPVVNDIEESIEFAVFGLTDPNATTDPADDVVTDWPRFLRFTVSIADPEDQETERTFQFVFAVPGGAG